MASEIALCAFFCLSFIRGSFPLLIHYGMASYKVPSLLFLLRTPGTIVLFGISTLYLYLKASDSKLEITNNLKSARSYRRAAILGFVQLSGPYILFMYALKFLSPTVGAVFMSSTPYCTQFMLKLLSITSQRNYGNRWNSSSTLIGVFGILAVTMANIFIVTMDTTCEARYDNLTGNRSNEVVQVKPNTCLTSLEVSTACLALFGATCLWSVSAVISQLKRVNIFYLIGGLLNNAFAGVYAVIIWVIVQQHINTDNVVWNSVKGSLSVSFLSIASSWIASLLLYYLYQSLGAKSTNRVMCLVPIIAWLEDLLFLHHLSGSQLWIGVLEAFGLVLVVAGLYLSSNEQDKNRFQEPLLPGYSSEEDDAEAVERESELTNNPNSEDELSQSVSSMQESLEPPIIHYVENDNNSDGI